MTTCEWYLMCDNPADGVVAHRILGDVPTCQRCADKLGLDLVVTLHVSVGQRPLRSVSVRGVGPVVRGLSATDDG